MVYSSCEWLNIVACLNWCRCHYWTRISIEGVSHLNKNTTFQIYPLEVEGAMPNMVSGVTGIIGLIGKGNILSSRWFLGPFFEVVVVWLFNFFWAGESAKRTCRGADDPSIDKPLYFSMILLADWRSASLIAQP